MLRRVAPLVAAAVLFSGCRREKTEETSAGPPATTGAAGTSAPAPRPPAPPRVPPGDPETRAELKEYHDTRSELAGKATMTEVVGLRIDVITDQIKVAHVEYEYELVAKEGRRESRSPYRWATTEDGAPKQVDRRTFEYKKEGQGFRIKSMGGRGSASFGADLEGWTDAQAIKTLGDFYDRKGVWSGQFRLGEVVRYRVDKTDDATKVGFVEYLYIPQPGNRRERGHDKRTFRFVKKGASWDVTQMGDFMSAAKGLMK